MLTIAQEVTLLLETQPFMNMKEIRAGIKQQTTDEYLYKLMRRMVKRGEVELIPLIKPYQYRKVKGSLSGLEQTTKAIEAVEILRTIETPSLETNEKVLALLPRLKEAMDPRAPYPTSFESKYTPEQLIVLCVGKKLRTSSDIEIAKKNLESLLRNLGEAIGIMD